MLRLPIALAAIAAATFLSPAASAQGTGKTVWVGQHLYDLEKDYSSVVRFAIELRIGEVRDRFDIGPALKAYLDGHHVQVDTTIEPASADLVDHFTENEDNALLVTSGAGIGAAADLESGVYFGPVRAGFGVGTARAKLLAVSSHAVADMYLRLLLHYALIKDAVTQNMDYKTVIGPLRETALSLVHQASPAQPDTVALIQNELIGLQP